MNWKNIKTFMIILMVGANIFLAAMLLTNSRGNVYSGDTAENISKLLSDAGITADKKFFNLDTKNAYVYDLDHGIGKASAVAEKLLGEAPEENFVTPESVKFFGADGSSLSYGKDLQILFLSSGADISDEISSEIPDSKTIKDAEALLKEALCPAGEDDFSLILRAKGKSNDVDYYLALQTLDSFEICNHTLMCGIKDGKIIYLSGKWCFLPTEEKLSAHLLDSVNILLNERNENTRSSNSESSDFGREAEVNAMEQCYLSRFFGEGSTLVFIPSWRIDWKDGRPSVYYDAVSGDPSNIMN